MDSVHTNRAYATEIGGLGYPLLSDWNPHGHLVDQLGIRVAEKGCPSRTTVIVDKDGVIRDIQTNALGDDRDFDVTLAKVAEINQGEAAGS
ncbi:MAG: putative reductase [Cyanobacteria bacterium RYN_339]|nr:putative reductase [Cyanobacteria bacterium RYN_339]